MKQILVLMLAVMTGAAAEASPPAPTTDFSRAEPGEADPGGTTTHHKRINRDAFSHAAANMSFERELDFKVGNGFFRRAWVSAPASTAAADGLGPLYNARSCQRCHLKDGRGHPPGGPGDGALAMFLRLSIPPRNDEDRRLLASHRTNVIPEPTYGNQFQDLAIQGHDAEGRVHAEYGEVAVELAGGEVVKLRRPTYSVANPAYGPLDDEVMMSPRVAPQMIGLGLLEAIDEADILALADPDDADADGVSGRPNRVWSPAKNAVMLGRFGWKAGEAGVDEQSQMAFANDMGISVPFHPAGGGECTAAQQACREAPNGNSPQYDGLEANKAITDLVAFYARNLAVPARRGAADPDVLEGKRLFYEIGCTSCHQPKYRTPADFEHPEQRDQLIWPYSDLLLHDMGDGLADGRPEGEAGPREWRTAPLWGIGLTPVVNGHSLYLHDGRARSLLEAILWHGGEAARHVEAVKALPPAQRRRLLGFIESL